MQCVQLKTSFQDQGGDVMNGQADMVMMMDDVDDAEPTEAQSSPQDGRNLELVTSRAAVTPSPIVKAALSLYKVQQSIYLLDFQRVEVSDIFAFNVSIEYDHHVCSQGDAFGFMKLCSLIVTELKNLSAASRAQQQASLAAQAQQQAQQILASGQQTPSQPAAQSAPAQLQPQLTAQSQPQQLSGSSGRANNAVPGSNTAGTSFRPPPGSTGMSLQERIAREREGATR
jgi:hypothetical protein